MKHKKLILLITVVLAIILAVAAVVYINIDAGAEKITVDLYFMNEQNTGIVADSCDIRYKDDVDLIENVLEKLRKSPTKSRRGRIMPRDTKVQRIIFNQDQITVDFSDRFLSDDPLKTVLSVYAVTKSLCSTGFVSAVKITVNSQSVRDRDGNPLGYVAASDINLETEEYSSEMRKVELYFGDKDSDKLVREERNIKITDQQPIEQYIINELIKGPASSALRRVLSEDTMLISVDVHDNICYLNFKSNFIKGNSGNEKREKQVIYSIVNSLTELQTISRVQFYIDGKRIDNFGNFKIKNYISRDTSIIKEKD